MKGFLVTCKSCWFVNTQIFIGRKGFIGHQDENHWLTVLNLPDKCLIYIYDKDNQHLWHTTQLPTEQELRRSMGGHLKDTKQKQTRRVFKKDNHRFWEGVVIKHKVHVFVDKRVCGEMEIRYYLKKQKRDYPFSLTLLVSATLIALRLWWDQVYKTVDNFFHNFAWGPKIAPSHGQFMSALVCATANNHHLETVISLILTTQ